MIKRIRLHNFKCYRAPITLDFSTGVNSFVGLTDAGKTAVLSAIEWVTENKPSGTGIINKPRGDKIASVTIWFDDGVTIERRRGKSENVYVLYKDKKREVLEGFGSQVPDEIREAINITSLNIHPQGKFLLDLTPSARAKYINTLVDLDDIDVCVNNINRDYDSTTQSIKRTKKLILENKLELKEYNWLPEAEKKIKAVQTLLDEHERCSHKISTLNSYYQTLIEIEQDLKSIGPTLSDVKEELSRLEKYKDSISTLRIEISDLEDLDNELDDNEEEIKSVKIKVRKFEKLLIELMPNVCPLCGNTNIKTDKLLQ